MIVAANAIMRNLTSIMPVLSGAWIQVVRVGRRMTQLVFRRRKLVRTGSMFIKEVLCGRIPVSPVQSKAHHFGQKD